MANNPHTKVEAVIMAHIHSMARAKGMVKGTVKLMVTVTDKDMDKEVDTVRSSSTLGAFMQHLLVRHHQVPILSCGSGSRLWIPIDRVPSLSANYN
jgi:3-mercaptopyruvate sulfurtransferase SseA